MAGPQNNGVNGAMAEQKESSVLFSLKELMSIEENRIREEEESKKRRAEEEVQAKLDADRRAREDEETRLRQEEERRRQEELRRKMEEAQVEAAKASEIEKRRLEDQHRLQMEALAKQQAHEREIHTIQSQKRRGIHPGIFAGVGILLVGIIILAIYFLSIKPKDDAKNAIAKAETDSHTDYTTADIDEPQWDDADKQLAIARDKDPTNMDIARVQGVVDGKRKVLAAAKKKEVDDTKAQLDALMTQLSDAKANGGNVADLNEQISCLSGGGTWSPSSTPKCAPKKGAPPVYTGGGVAAPVKPKNCHDVPGCPLCPQKCD